MIHLCAIFRCEAKEKKYEPLKCPLPSSYRDLIDYAIPDHLPKVSKHGEEKAAVASGYDLMPGKMFHSDLHLIQIVFSCGN